MSYVPDDKGEIAAIEQAAIATIDTMNQVAPPDLGASFTKMILSLTLIIFLLFATYWFLKRLIQQRLQKANSDAAIQILEKRVLSPKTMLYLVEVEGKRVLMAESHLEVKRLETLQDPTDTHR